MGTSGLLAAILNFQLPDRSHSISSNPIGLLDPENIGIAVRIVLLSCLQVEIDVFPDWRPPSWSFDFRLRRTVFPIVPSDFENMGVTDGISFLSCLGAEIFIAGWYPPPYIGTSLFLYRFTREQHLFLICAPKDVEVSSKEADGSVSENFSRKKCCV